MHPAWCPRWEYSTDPYADPILQGRTKEVLLWVVGESRHIQSRACHDTRHVHGWCFRDLVPSSVKYYAGHYRGENFACLRYSQVGIPSNPLVGAQPTAVFFEITALADDVRAALRQLDHLHRAPDILTSRAEKLRRTIEVVAAVFSAFLVIHPYVNGNGHMGRFIAVTLMIRFGLRPQRFPVHPSPSAPYSQVIKRYQNGDTEPLIEYFLSCL
jgi:hypothetical protein